jgi:hypothetical protein
MLLLLVDNIMHIHRDPPQLVLVVDALVWDIAPILQKWGKYLLLFHSLVHSFHLHICYGLYMTLI